MGTTVLTHNLACPTCLKDGKENPIKTAAGKFSYFCDAGHQFMDTEELMSYAPPSLSRPLPKKPPTPPPGAVELRILVAGSLHKALVNRFGDRLQVSAAAILQAMTEPRSFIVPQVDVGRLGQHLAREIRHVDELVGAVYDVVTDRNKLRDRLQALETQSGATPGAVAPQAGKVPVTLYFDPDIAQQISEKARFRGESTERCLETTIGYALANQWF